MQMWTASQLHVGVSIEDAGGTMEVTEVYQGDGYVEITGIYASNGEETSFEISPEASVKVVAF